MTIYAKISYTKGNVTTSNYKDWIALNYMQFGTQRNMPMRVGSTTDRMNSAPQFSEVTLYKKTDPATVDMFSLFCSNEVLPQVEVHFCADTTNGATPTPTMKYIFHNAAIVNHRHFIGNDGLPTEEAMLNYTKMELSHMGRDGSNNALAPKRAGYDLEQAKKL